jgi:2-polyprenyl-3-methyl-5-hydroxy-6-metoxy-1,4-benzoquinol methylase
LFATRILDLARQFTSFLAETEKRQRRCGMASSTAEVNDQVAGAFWELFDAVRDCEAGFGGAGLAETKQQFRAILTPWLCRSRYWWRSLFKPHGYAGDYRMVEWMYDLEEGAGSDPTQPALVNALDYTFATVHSVRSLWERRRWFADLLRRELAGKPRARVLDVACGGARYIKDCLSSAPAGTEVTVTLVDQDSSAAQFAREEALAAWKDRVTAVAVPIKQLPSHLRSGEYDVVISAGLFDYLPAETASHLLRHLLSLTVRGGVVALSNYHPEDRSACVKDWAVDWQLIYRDEAAAAGIFPAGVNVETSRSANHALTFAWARRR